jgi:hypothetical protein
VEVGKTGGKRREGKKERGDENGKEVALCPGGD